MAEPISVTVRASMLYSPISDEQIITLFFPSRSITVRDLICERVTQEVQAYNQARPAVFRGLVTPGEAEKNLNGYRLPRQHIIDVEKQCRLACQAFEQNGFLIIVDDRQVTELDERLELHNATAVEFIKLTPLVGG